MKSLDIEKCYKCKKCFRVIPGFSEYLEYGIRSVVCRKCRKASCCIVCPVSALDYNDKGILKRNKMKCISCGKCSIACPVGANPFEINEFKNTPATENDIKKSISICRENAYKEIEEPVDGAVIKDKLIIIGSDWK